MIRQVKTVSGRLIDERTVELDEAVEATGERVEVRVPIGPAPGLQSGASSIPSLLEFIRSLPVRGVPKEELDRQLHRERESWGDR